MSKLTGSKQKPAGVSPEKGAMSGIPSQFEEIPATAQKGQTLGMLVHAGRCGGNGGSGGAGGGDGGDGRAGGVSVSGRQPLMLELYRLLI